MNYFLNWPAMRRLISFLLPALLFLGSSAYAQKLDTLGFVNRIFECLDNNDQSGFLQLMPTKDELNEIREIAIETDSIFIPPPVDSIYQKMVTVMTKNFENLLNRGEERGISWAPLKSGDLQVAIYEPDARSPIQISKIRIDLMTNDRPNTRRIQVAAIHDRLFLIDSIKLSY